MPRQQIAALVDVDAFLNPLSHRLDEHVIGQKDRQRWVAPELIAEVAGTDLPLFQGRPVTNVGRRVRRIRRIANLVVALKLPDNLKLARTWPLGRVLNVDHGMGELDGSRAAKGSTRGVVFRARDLLVRQRTQLINALRGHLAEYGVVAAQGPAHLKLLQVAVDAPASELPTTVRDIVGMYLDQISQCTEKLTAIEKTIRAETASSEARRSPCAITYPENPWNPPRIGRSHRQNAR